MGEERFGGGPFLKAALICEKSLEEKDGVLSFIRVVDRTIVEARGTGAPAKMPPFLHSFTVVIMLVAGDARGAFPVRLEIEAPAGTRQKGPELTAFMEGGERGQNLILNTNLQVKDPGLYWFDVFVEDKRITRIPLRVLYTRTVV